MSSAPVRFLRLDVAQYRLVSDMGNSQILRPTRPTLLDHDYQRGPPGLIPICANKAALPETGW